MDRRVIGRTKIMFGAIIGDITGSRFEFIGNKSKDFDLLTEECRVTDDSVMTAAVAEALLSVSKDSSEEEVKDAIVRSMRDWGRRYPCAGYGGRFAEWLVSDYPEPYNSFGNGSAMRVSAAGWLYDSIGETRRMARLTSVVTHDHEEGIKGAESVASAIFLARTGASKEEIKNYIEKEFGYDLSRTCDEIRPGYAFDETCQGSVPESFAAFLDGSDYEDVIRNAVSLGGDADTQAAIAGSIAEAYFGIPDEIIERAKEYIPEDIMQVAREFAAHK